MHARTHADARVVRPGSSEPHKTVKLQCTLAHTYEPAHSHARKHTHARAHTPPPAGVLRPGSSEPVKVELMRRPTARISSATPPLTGPNAGRAGAGPVQKEVRAINRSTRYTLTLTPLRP